MGLGEFVAVLHKRKEDPEKNHRAGTWAGTHGDGHCWSAPQHDRDPAMAQYLRADVRKMKAYTPGEQVRRRMACTAARSRRTLRAGLIVLRLS